MDGGSQFIRARRGDEILGKTLTGLYKFWNDHDKMVNYFVWFNFFTLATQSSKLATEEWFRVPSFYFETCMLLAREWLKQMSDEKWNYLRNISFVHKLSYREEIPEDKDLSGTYYEKILSDETLEFLK